MKIRWPFPEYEQWRVVGTLESVPTASTGKSSGRSASPKAGAAKKGGKDASPSRGKTEEEPKLSKGNSNSKVETQTGRMAGEERPEECVVVICCSTNAW